MVLGGWGGGGHTPLAHLLFSTTKMQGSLYRVAMLSDS